VLAGISSAGAETSSRKPLKGVIAPYFWEKLHFSLILSYIISDSVNQTIMQLFMRRGYTALTDQNVPLIDPDKLLDPNQSFYVLEQLSPRLEITSPEDMNTASFDDITSAQPPEITPSYDSHDKRHTNSSKWYRLPCQCMKDAYFVHERRTNDQIYHRVYRLEGTSGWNLKKLRQQRKALRGVGHKQRSATDITSNVILPLPSKRRQRPARAFAQHLCTQTYRKE
jgi:hypothetical protein